MWRFKQISSTVARRVTESPSDADADAFISATGITDTTQKQAIQNLVTDLKDAGLWARWDMLYPFVGGTATTHKYNLKDPRDLDAAFRITFSGAVTHDSNGITGTFSSTTHQCDIHYNTGLVTQDDNSMWYYDKTARPAENTNIMHDMGGDDHFIMSQWNGPGDENYYAENSNPLLYSTFPSGGTQGFTGMSRIIGSEYKVFRDGALVYTANTANDASRTIVAQNVAVAGRFGSTASSDNYAFFAIGGGLTPAEVTTFNTIIQDYQTALGRQTYDADAETFISAAGITAKEQKQAINTLVIDLKFKGLWDKSVALYPFVGGTATTHKYNLKNPLDTDAGFRITFGTGFTHSANGVDSDGSSGAVAGTNIIPATNLAGKQNNLALHNYVTEATAGAFQDLGFDGTTHPLFITPSYNGTAYFAINSQQSSATAMTIQAITSVSRLSATEIKAYTNGVLIHTEANNSTGLDATGEIGVVGMGTSSIRSQRNSAFVGVTEGFTDTEMLDFYNAVEKYQTTLGRENPIL